MHPHLLHHITYLFRIFYYIRTWFVWTNLYINLKKLSALMCKGYILINIVTLHRVKCPLGLQTRRRRSKAINFAWPCGRPNWSWISGTSYTSGCWTLCYPDVKWLYSKWYMCYTLSTLTLEGEGEKMNGESFILSIDLAISQFGSVLAYNDRFAYLLTCCPSWGEILTTLSTAVGA